MAAEKFLLNDLLAFEKSPFYLSCFFAYPAGLFSQVDNNNVEETDAFQYQPENSNETLQWTPQNSDANEDH